MFAFNYRGKNGSGDTSRIRIVSPLPLDRQGSAEQFSCKPAGNRNDSLNAKLRSIRFHQIPIDLPGVGQLGNIAEP